MSKLIDRVALSMDPGVYQLPEKDYDDLTRSLEPQELVHLAEAGIILQPEIKNMQLKQGHPLDNQILKAREFENSKVGQILTGTKYLGRILTAFGGSVDTRPLKLSDRLEQMKQDDISGDRFAGIKRAGRDIVSSAIGVGAMATGQAPAKAASLIPKGGVGLSRLASGLGRTATQTTLGALQGAASSGAIEAIQGGSREDIEKAAKIGGTLGGAAELVTFAPKAIELFSDVLGQITTKLPRSAVTWLKKNPELVINPPPDTKEVLQDINWVLDAFEDRASAKYDLEFGRLGDSGTTVVDVSEIPKIIKEQLKLNPEDVARTVQQNRKDYNIDPDRLYQVFAGKTLPEPAPKKLDPLIQKLREATELVTGRTPQEISKPIPIEGPVEITVQEGLEINKILRNLSKFQSVEGAGTGNPGKYGQLKTVLLSKIDQKFKGVKDLNREYADVVKVSKEIRKVLNSESDFSTIRKIGQDVTEGATKNKHRVHEALQKIDDEMDTDLITHIANAWASESFTSLGGKAWINYLPLAIGAGVGGGVSAMIDGGSNKWSSGSLGAGIGLVGAGLLAHPAGQLHFRRGVQQILDVGVRPATEGRFLARGIRLSDMIRENEKEGGTISDGLSNQ